MTGRPARHLLAALGAVALAAALAAALAGPGASTALAAALAAGTGGTSNPPRVPAEASIVVDRATGAVIAADDPHQRRPIASTTKLMTALLALERTEPGAVLRATGYEADPIESQIGLEKGERLSVRDLLVALLLESANDAAATLAARVGGSTRAFVGDMNERADELRLEDTSYANPIGFDAPKNYSTAADLARLARVLMEDALFRDIVEEPRLELKTGAERRVVENRNELVGEAPHVDGVKTGHTLGAGHVLVGSATRGDAGVISVVLGAPSEAARDSATLELLEYGLDRFATRRVLRAREPIGEAAVVGRDESVPVAADRSVSLTVPRGEPVRTRLRAPEELEGPLPEGEEVGSVAVVLGGEVVERAPLVTARAVPGPEDVLTRLGSTLREHPIPVAAGALVVVVLLALAGAQVVRSRRRAA